MRKFLPGARLHRSHPLQYQGDGGEGDDEESSGEEEEDHFGQQKMETSVVDIRDDDDYSFHKTTGATGLGIDWSCSARNARYLSGGNITLQGNYDPAKLLSPISKIKSEYNHKSKTSSKSW